VSDQGPTIAALQIEERVFPPSDEFVARARITSPDIYEKARGDLEGFRAEQAPKPAEAPVPKAPADHI